MSLSENIEYTVRIPPNGAEIVKLHPIFSELYFKFRSSSSVEVCVLDEEKECVVEGKPMVTKQG